MAKQRGYADRRGMGAQSDFIGESFVPSERYVTQQEERVRILTAAGLGAEELERLFLVAPAVALPEAPGQRSEAKP